MYFYTPSLYAVIIDKIKEANSCFLPQWEGAHINNGPIIKNDLPCYNEAILSKKNRFQIRSLIQSS